MGRQRNRCGRSLDTYQQEPTSEMTGSCGIPDIKILERTEYNSGPWEYRIVYFAGLAERGASPLRHRSASNFSTRDRDD